MWVMAVPFFLLCAMVYNLIIFNRLAAYRTSVLWSLVALLERGSSAVGEPPYVWCVRVCETEITLISIV